MEENKNITINISTSTVLKIVGIFLFLAFAYLVKDILLVLFIAIIFATLIEPLVNKAEEKKIPRGAGIAIIYVVILLFLVLVVRLLVPPIVEQVGLLSNNFPDFWSKITQNYESVRQYSEDKGLLTNIQQGLDGIKAGLSKAATGVYGFIVSIFKNLINFVVILVVTFYLVLQRNALSKVFKAVAPSKYHLYLDGQLPF